MTETLEPLAPERRSRGGRRGFFRSHKILSTVLALLLIAVVVAGGWLYYLNSRLAAIEHFPLEPATAAARPPAVPGSAENILLIGVDNPVAASQLFAVLASGKWDPGTYRSDAILVLHIDADRKGAQVVSIPRDSYVDVPDEGQTKINAAFSAGGPSELTHVVEQVSGIRIDHAVVIDFNDFANLTTALGGVDVTIPQTVFDPENNVTWHQGEVHLEGANALLYVRQRYGLPGSDFDRIKRQQNLLRAILGKLSETGKLTNPIKLTSLVGELSNFVAVDNGLTPSALRALALSARHIRASDVRFVTIPVTGTPTINGASVVTIDFGATKQLFSAVAHDRFTQWYRQQDEVQELPGPDQVR